MPTDSITVTMLEAMKAKTPIVPNLCKKNAHISPEFRERVAVEVGLFKPMLDPNGPNLQQTKVA